jgi:hypothetical protein
VPNILSLTVEQPDEVRNAGAYDTGALMRVQWSATETGSFVDISGTGSTPTIAVVAATRAYTGYDPAGTVSTWYRTRFENAGGTRLSDWSSPFQVAPEGSGLICSLWDVKQALGLTNATEDENLLEAIRQVGSEIASVTGRQFIRSPASGTATWVEDIGHNGLLCVDGRTLYYPKGIAALTTLEVASTSQPETGGTYATVPAADWFLRPTAASRDDGWPATRIVISDLSSSWFSTGYNIVRFTGARGFDAVPYNIQGVAQRAVVSSFLSKGSGGVNAAIGPTGAMTILRHISPADMATLMRYAVINV